MSVEKNHRWEEWQLTAYALGELDSVTSAKLADSEGRDQSLAREIEAIRITATQVAEVYAADQSAGGLESGKLSEILTAAEELAARPVSRRQATAPSRRSRQWVVWAAVALGLGWVVVGLVLPSVQMAREAADRVRPYELAMDSDEKQEPANRAASKGMGESRYGNLGSQSAVEPTDEIVASSQRGSSASKESIVGGYGGGGYGEYGSGGPGSMVAKPGSGAGGPSAGGPGGDYSGDGYGGNEIAASSNSVARGKDNAQTASLKLPNSPASARGGAVAGSGGLGAGSGGMGGYGGGGYGGGGSGGGGSGGGGSGGGVYGGGVYGGGVYGGGGSGGGGSGGDGYGGGGYGGGMGSGGGGSGGGGYGGGGYGGGGYGGERRESISPSPGIDYERRMRARGLSIGLAKQSGGQFSGFSENEFRTVKEMPLSTFSIDVDTAAYAKCRQMLLEYHTSPPPAAVRLEEFINYFEYEYAGPEGDAPFAAHLAVSTCPWAPKHQVVRIALQAEKIELEQRPDANVVFLLDVSGSMGGAKKLPLVKESIRMMVRQLSENDRVAIVVYAGAAGCVLRSTSGDQQTEILAALDRLESGGSTNGGQGIQLAYDMAREHRIPGGVNRVVLCTDGDFNVGVTNTEELVGLVAENARSNVFLTVLGFGMGNTNDAMMEEISNKGNGIYGFVDNHREAHRQMVSQLAGNLVTVAKDVKIQVEFNPAKVQSYRLLGYENRVMAAEDFNDDLKDAGEIGAGHRVTAMYEIVPVGVDSSWGRSTVDPLRYQTEESAAVDKVSVAEAEEAETEAEVESLGGGHSNELLAVKLRYKEPEGDVSKLLLFPLQDGQVVEFEQADRDLRWAASMVEFGMLLRNSSFKGQSNWQHLIDQAQSAAGISPGEDYSEALSMIRTARQLTAQ